MKKSKEKEIYIMKEELDWKNFMNPLFWICATLFLGIISIIIFICAFIPILNLYMFEKLINGLGNDEKTSFIKNVSYKVIKQKDSNIYKLEKVNYDR